MKTRTEVLDAAEHCFCTLGVSATGVQEIADQAGCSRGAIYFHFKNRHAIMRAVLDRGRRSLSFQLESVLAGPAPFLPALRDCLCQFLIDIHSDSHARAVVRILYLRCDFAGSNHELLKDYMREQEAVHRLLEDILNRARRAEEISGSVTARSLGLALSLAINGALRTLALDPSQVSKRDLLDGLSGWLEALVPEVKSVDIGPG